jgi:hypothetical protein
MTNITNKRNTFYDMLKNSLLVSGGYQAANIVNIIDDNFNSNIEIFVGLGIDRLAEKNFDEGYTTGFEKREMEFSVNLRKKLKTTKDAYKDIREESHAELEKLERLLRNINLQQYRLTLNNNIIYDINITEIRIDLSAYILSEILETQIEGTIIYEFSKY